MILSGWEAVFFWVFSIAAIFAGLLTVMARNTIHSALFLISSLVSVAALFILLHAEFIAGVQILVYVGGVMVLFLFVIMLVNVGAEERGRDEIFNGRARLRPALSFALYSRLDSSTPSTKDSEASRRETRKAFKPRTHRVRAGQLLAKSATGSSRITDDTQRMGSSLYRFGSLPFEIASVLLLVAIIGSVMLARTLKQEAAVDDVDPKVLQKEASHDSEIAEVQQESIT